ncbi:MULTISPECIES: hypothetical protein [unclassified Crossiella]|uniref:hypothetical protein n=1 Tax=unclassified Crossiella TaxID=2620835 RepID=UPI001FFE5965|nr:MULTISPECIES: hypothetical protein [unclassified Crossiella]MCK2245456.1 hypothetical protein [Crossiella sp. S99.2]MCK2259108.1 hypothetical protein [Crossiella sp. S99.1]
MLVDFLSALGHLLTLGLIITIAIVPTLAFSALGETERPAQPGADRTRATARQTGRHRLR